MPVLGMKLSLAKEFQAKSAPQVLDLYFPYSIKSKKSGYPVCRWVATLSLRMTNGFIRPLLLLLPAHLHLEYLQGLLLSLQDLPILLNLLHLMEFHPLDPLVLQAVS